MMNETAKFLCNNVQGCKLAYVQSDEISLLITDYDTPDTDILFGGRLCKIQSILASMATSEFNRQFILYNLSDKLDVGFKDVSFDDVYNLIEKMKMAQFDCKAWVVPNENDAYAWFLYRNIDCVRNSKQQTAQTWCSHKELMGKDTDEQIEYLFKNHGIDWNTFENGKKYGRFITKVKQHLTTIVKGEKIEYDRNKFDVIEPPFMLSEDGGKDYFFEMLKNNMEKN
jgi:tRNA(His) 5'-end guanylyltransferase